ncbi:unnamed protein product [Effrenium voratum]|nr:unnamed protein product [Effrenium voratum]
MLYYQGVAEAGQKILADRQLLREQLTPSKRGLIIAMVGLPARGKSFISRKVERFLQWGGNRTQTFNVGKYRRDAVDPGKSGRSDFFDNNNPVVVAAREKMAMAALADALQFLDEGGKFAIFDATNSTVARRRQIADKVNDHGQYSLIWVEALCDDEEVVKFNMLTKARNEKGQASRLPLLTPGFETGWGGKRHQPFEVKRELESHGQWDQSCWQRTRQLAKETRQTPRIEKH